MAKELVSGEASLSENVGSEVQSGRFSGTGSGSIDDERAGDEAGAGDELSTDSGSDDGTGESADSGSTGADNTEGSESAQDTQWRDVPESNGESGEQSGAVEPQVYEGVTQESFDTLAQGVNEKFDAMNAMCLVLVVAVFVCAGIMAVDVLVRRMERF